MDHPRYKLVTPSGDRSLHMYTTRRLTALEVIALHARANASATSCACDGHDTKLFYSVVPA